MLSLELIDFEHQWYFFYQMLGGIGVSTCFINCLRNFDQGIHKHKSGKDFEKVRSANSFDFTKTLLRNMCNFKKHVASALVGDDPFGNEEIYYDFDRNVIYEIRMYVWIENDSHFPPPEVHKLILVSN